MRVCGTLAVLAVLLLAGCGAGGGTETSETSSEAPGKMREVQVTLDGWEGPENVGLLMADERGYFADAGLKVSIYTPATPTRPVEYVVDGTDDIGVSNQPQVVLAKEKGAPIVAVGSLISQPTMAMIWLKKSRIRDVADLKGKTIAVPGLPFQEAFLQGLLAGAGLTLEDVKVENVGYKLVPALVSGRADAIFGGSWNIEGAKLESHGLKPVITRVENLGFPAYEELVVIARTDRVAEEPQLIRDFMSAVARGTAAAVEDPRGAVEVIESSVESNPESSRKDTEVEIEATLPLLSKTGYMNSGQASHLVNWMHEQGSIQRKIPVSELLTNDYLTQQP